MQRLIDWSFDVSIPVSPGKGLVVEMRRATVAVRVAADDGLVAEIALNLVRRAVERAGLVPPGRDGDDAR